MTEEITVTEAANKVKDSATKLFTPKGIARFVVGSSVKFVVTSAITSLVPTETKVDKAKVLVGAYVISGIIAEQAKSYISEDIEEKLAFFREVMAQVKKIENESPTP